MDLGSLKLTQETARKRVGRGNGSGKGKTCGRGTKGQGSRSGGSIHPWFEGGQMPLYRRMPIRGFNNKRFTKRFQIVSLARLSDISEEQVIGPAFLHAKGLINKEDLPIKILGNGSIEKPLKIEAHSFTKSAVEKIKAAGGEAVVIAKQEEQAE